MSKIRYIRLVSVFTVAILWAANVSAQEGRDMALSIPQVMTVDAVDVRTGELILSGQRYLVVLDANGDRRLTVASSSVDSELSLRDLRPGMQVQVQTDGTLASNDNAPIVLSITRAYQ